MGGALKNFVEELLQKLGYDGTVEVTEGHRTLIAVTSPDSKKLIGPGGEHLRSLNTIAKRIIETKHGEEASNF